jgi:hypothetical protein
LFVAKVGHGIRLTDQSKVVTARSQLMGFVLISLIPVEFHRAAAATAILLLLFVTDAH